MKERKLERGNLTVEAAFVFPIVFFALMAIIYMSHYMADKCKGQSVVDSYAQKQAICLKERYDLGKEPDYNQILKKGVFFYLNSLSKEETNLANAVKKELSCQLLMGKVRNVNAKVSYGSVSITAKISITIGVSKVKEFFTGTPLEYTVSVKIPVHDPEEFARGYTAMDSTIDNVAGQNKIKKQLKKVKENSKNINGTKR